MSGAITALEREIAGIQEIIARRESQVGNHQHEGTFSDTSKHIAAARVTLRQKATDLIVLRCNGGGYDPLEIIRRMSAPATPAQPAPVIQPEPTLALGDATRARLQNLLNDMRGATFIPRSKLTEILSK